MASIQYTNSDYSGLAQAANFRYGDLGLKGSSALGGLLAGMAAGRKEAREFGLEKEKMAMLKDKHQQEMSLAREEMNLRRDQMAEQTRLFEAKADEAAKQMAEKETKEVIEKKAAAGYAWSQMTPQQKEDPQVRSDFAAHLKGQGIIDDKEAEMLVTSPTKNIDSFAKFSMATSSKALDYLKPPGKGQNINVNTAKPPAGYAYNEDGTKLVPIPGGPGDKLNLGETAKFSALEQARDELQEVNKLVFKKDGTVDRVNLFNAQVGTPFTEGRELAQRMERVSMSKLRVDSGAAITNEEMVRYEKMFTPSPLDSDEQIKAKLKAMDSFIARVSTGMRDGMTGEEKADIFRQAASESSAGLTQKSESKYSDSDISAYAKKHNLSEEDVRRRLK